MSAVLASTVFSLPESPFPPLAIGFFGLGTGYLIYGTQELAGYPSRDERVDGATGWACGACGCLASCSSWPAPTCSPAWRCSARSRPRRSTWRRWRSPLTASTGSPWAGTGSGAPTCASTWECASPYLCLSILGVIVFFGVHDDPVGGVFIGLVGVYATEFVASLSPDLPGIGGLAERTTGFFRIGTGLWLIYLTFAVALNFILSYNLPL